MAPPTAAEAIRGRPPSSPPAFGERYGEAL